MRASFNLKDLRITVTTKSEIPNLNKVVNLFSANSIRGLQRLHMIFEYRDEWCSKFPLIAQSITTNLGHLEGLCLAMGLDTAWKSMFTKLANLKRLIWYVPEEACRNSLAKDPSVFDLLLTKSHFENLPEPNTIFGVLRGLEMSLIAKQLFQNEFALHSEARPFIGFHIIPRGDFFRVSSCGKLYDDEFYFNDNLYIDGRFHRGESDGSSDSNDDWDEDEDEDEDEDV
jgi:hypothetical protein